MRMKSALLRHTSAAPGAPCIRPSQEAGGRVWAPLSILLRLAFTLVVQGTHAAHVQAHIHTCMWQLNGNLYAHMLCSVAAARPHAQVPGQGRAGAGRGRPAPRQACGPTPAGHVGMPQKAKQVRRWKQRSGGEGGGRGRSGCIASGPQAPTPAKSSRDAPRCAWVSFDNKPPQPITHHEASSSSLTYGSRSPNPKNPNPTQPQTQTPPKLVRHCTSHTCGIDYKPRALAAARRQAHQAQCAARHTKRGAPATQGVKKGWVVTARRQTLPPDMLQNSPHSQQLQTPHSAAHCVLKCMVGAVAGAAAPKTRGTGTTGTTSSGSGARGHAKGGTGSGRPGLPPAWPPVAAAAAARPPRLPLQPGAQCCHEGIKAVAYESLSCGLIVAQAC